MTDNDVIKALRCCKTMKCKDCPFTICDSNCDNVENLALNLIENQKTEIQKLNVFIEELNDKTNSVIDCYKQTKSEIIKEFAEKLKRQIDMISYETGFEHQETIETIDNLVKEMEKY